jgi:hypothetical protein
MNKSVQLIGILERVLLELGEAEAIIANIGSEKAEEDIRAYIRNIENNVYTAIAEVAGRSITITE